MVETLWMLMAQWQYEDHGMSDAQIVRRILDGHINDFALLLQRYGPYLHRIVSGMVPAADVPDLVQDVFLKAFDGLDGYAQRGTLKSWLASIAVRTCQEHWRRQGAHSEISENSLGESCRQEMAHLLGGRSVAEHDEAQTQQEACKVLHRALQRLSETDRTILTLTYLEDLSFKEAAAILGCSQMTAKVRAHRARGALRRQLEILMRDEL